MLTILILGFLLSTNTWGAVQFPNDFKWCVATSAHQIEGDNRHSDFWNWERQAGRIENGDRSGMAANHWNLVKEDTALIKGLGAGMYRMSVEWAKIEPEQGKFDQRALDHYRDEILHLRSQGIEPMVTLHHFTHPQWFMAQGGWAGSKAPELFDRYVQRVYLALGDQVEWWVTINEPMVLLLHSYVEGIFPPGLKDFKSAEAPLVGMLEAHARAYHRLKTMAYLSQRPAKIGLAHHLRVFEGHHQKGFFKNLANAWFAGILDNAWNWALMDALKTGRLRLRIPTVVSINRKIKDLKETQDFIGINYYSRDHVELTLGEKEPFRRRVPEGAPVTDIGWEIYPEGLFEVLSHVQERYRKLGLDIYILENGLADHRDQMRSRFMRDHLRQVHRAIQNGIPVKGYCHWSLIDNFEWALGFAPRFGLFEVDYKTFKRTPRRSALVFREIIRNNGF